MLARNALTKICPCVGGRCLTASLSRIREAGRLDVRRRALSTAPENPSIFSPEVSPWDEIFDDIGDAPAPQHQPVVAPRSLKYKPAGRTQGGKMPRAVAMTFRESQVFDEMFDTVFNANAAAGVQSVAGIGQQRSAALGGLYSKLRNSRKLRWTSEADEALDRKKEEMELCETDLQLLEWAMREVFGESERYEEDALRASKESPSTPSPDSTSKSVPSRLQPYSYPHLLAALMRTFRDKYKDPHLALAMFDHARNLSIASFVFGCTTPAYNELIQTRWECFRNLRGVCEALEEMRVNGVDMDSRTRLLAETIRREVGERTLWQEESSVGSGEVWEMVARIERLTVRPDPKRLRRAVAQRAEDAHPVQKRKWTARRETWKEEALDVGARDNWTFDQWTRKRTNTDAKQKRPLRG